VQHEFVWLLLTAAGLGFLHTLIGPDHYLPFIAMARIRNWSRQKLTLITAACGLAHVLSSALLGLMGVALGLSVAALETTQATRGQIAAWLLMGFGLAYFVWGLRRIYKARRHAHPHLHTDGLMHIHSHDHFVEHAHIHYDSGAESISGWVLFTIFVFGPCEALIPLVMYSAAKTDWIATCFIIAAFGASTISTMLTTVLTGHAGVQLLSSRTLAPWAPALGGVVIFICGLAVILGL
jgi:nickel/cobalt transporter (NicO) family protein